MVLPGPRGGLGQRNRGPTGPMGPQGPAAPGDAPQGDT
eukprot:gene14040-14155_t